MQEKGQLKEKVLFAGFGGQGILAAGKIYAEACIESDLNASWLPSYGPEMRGGTCNCKVVISDGEILSPIFTRPTVAVIMNQASLERFADKMIQTRMIVINSSLVEVTDEMRDRLKDVELVEVPATDTALELGSVRCANMVVLGAFAKHSSALSIDLMKKSIENKFRSKPGVVELNLKALDKGYEIA